MRHLFGACSHIFFLALTMRMLPTIVSTKLAGNWALIGEIILKMTDLNLPITTWICDIWWKNTTTFLIWYYYLLNISLLVLFMFSTNMFTFIFKQYLYPNSQNTSHISFCYNFILRRKTTVISPIRTLLHSCIYSA